MKLIELHLETKKENLDKIVLFRYGVFYRVYGDDAYILWSLLGFHLSEELRLGFPMDQIEGVLTLLKENHLSYYVRKEEDAIVLHDDQENQYFKMLEKAKEKLAFETRKKMVFEKIETTLKDHPERLTKLEADWN